MSTYPDQSEANHERMRQTRELAQQRQGAYNQWPPNQLQPAPTAHYPRLSEEDVQRIAIAVVARLELLRSDAG